MGIISKIIIKHNNLPEDDDYDVDSILFSRKSGYDDLGLGRRVLEKY